MSTFSSISSSKKSLSECGEKGKDGSSWDEYYLSAEQRERESEWFKDPNNPTQTLIVVDMLLVGYDVPIVQVMYLDNGLREHNLLQAIARVVCLAQHVILLIQATDNTQQVLTLL